MSKNLQKITDYRINPSVEPTEKEVAHAKH